MDYHSLIESIFLHPRPWVLSGAGISTESGIADFRGPGGLWERIDPMEYFSVDALYKNPKGFYTLGMEMFQFMDRAEPNAAHIVLGEFQQKRLIGPIVTQNIDSLHQKGGANHVYEVHGHVRTATCMDCHKTTVSQAELGKMIQDGAMPPRCGCGGLLKPDVILFGDMMPHDYQEARLMLNVFQGAEQSVIVVGSTLTVSPINMFPLEFEEMNIINYGSTAMDKRAHLLFDGKAGEIMTELRRSLEEMNGNQPIDKLPAGFLPGVIISSIRTAGEKLAKTGSSASSGKSSYCLADSILALEMAARYPRRGSRQALEEHWLNVLQDEGHELESKCTGTLRSAKFDKMTDSSIINSLSEYSISCYRAVERYRKQTRYERDVLSELMLKALGAAGLQDFALKTAGLQEYAGEVTILVDKLSAIARQEELVFDYTNAMADI